MTQYRLARLMKLFINVCLFLSIQLLGVLSYWAGDHVRLTASFLIPVMLITWRMGGTAGYIATINALAILTFESITDSIEKVDWVLYSIDIVSRFISFFIIVFILTKLRESYSHLNAAAVRDNLTQLYSRLGFRELVEVEIKKSRRNLHPFSLIFLDCDNFKSVNDQWGHETGDQLLCAVADGMVAAVRSSDIVCRLGGDEFVIFVADIEEEKLESFAQKIKQHLDGIMFTNHWPVTFSIGVAFFETAPGTIDEVIHFADSLMYEVKNSGKNRLLLGHWTESGSKN